MKYAPSVIINHWLTFGLVLGMAGTGLAYRYELADNGAMLTHQYMGQALIVVLVIRIITRLVKRRIISDTARSAEDVLAHLVHLALYAVLLVYVGTGYVAASAFQDPDLIWPADLAFARSDTGELLLELHYTLKWVLLTLMTIHVAGALKHLVVPRENALHNITFTSRKG